MRCVMCQHWKPYDEENVDHAHRCPRDWGQCESPRLYAGYSFLSLEDHADDHNITVEADEGWGMFTSPTFGCVNFTAKG